MAGQGGVRNPRAFQTRTSPCAIRLLRAWKRDWKIALFKDINPRWEDLYPAMAAQSPFG